MLSSRQRRETEALLWTVAEYPYAVECQWSLLEELNGLVQDGFRKLSRGGVEVGGLLYGRRSENLVRILAWRPIECEHSRGPGFILSNNDKQSLVRQIEESERDPNLQVLEPIGWFVSHTRASVSMTEDDLEIFNRFFPEPWQITLVVHPVKGGPSQAGFFQREMDGGVQRDKCYREFPIQGSRIALPPTTGETRTAVKRRPAAPVEAPAKYSAPWGIIAAAVLMLSAIALFAVPKFRTANAEAIPLEPINLRLLDSRGQLRIEWDKKNGVIAGADSASLIINDRGPLTPIDLDKETTQKGSVTYARMSEDVTVRLVVKRGGQKLIEELARYVGPPVPKVETREMRQLRQNRERLYSEAERLREQLDQQTANTRRLEREVKKLQAQKY